MTHVIVTGGTLDKAYTLPEGELSFAETHIPAMLERARAFGHVTVERLMMIDSLEMAEAHRLKIARSCKTSSDEHIVVTHGTDTMAETARRISAYAEKRQKLAAKTIVLTGAMVPFSVNDPPSDALFNLGAAFAFANLLPSGVWVAMNGRAIPAKYAHKDRELGMFIDSSEPE